MQTVIRESDRLAALHRLDVLDDAEDTESAQAAALAGQICGAPFAFVTLIDADRQRVKAAIGADARGVPRELAFCDQTIRGTRPLVVPDTTLDPRFAGHPAVVDHPHVRFYAGAPLITADDHAVGTLCVADVQPRTLTHGQEQTLSTLAWGIIHRWELRHAGRAEDRLIGEFLSTISHEIRTPLSSIRGYVELLSEEGMLAAPTGADLLDAINRNTGRLLGLIDDVLLVARH